MPNATVGLHDNGELKQEAACGDGPVDAAYKAIDAITGVKVELVEYNLKAIGTGRWAKGEAAVKIKDNGHVYIGQAVSVDIIEASAKAYLEAINNMLATKNLKKKIVGGCTIFRPPKIS